MSDREREEMDEMTESLLAGNSSPAISLDVHKPTSLADVAEVIVALNENTKETNRLLRELIKVLDNGKE